MMSSSRSSFAKASLASLLFVFVFCHIHSQAQELKLDDERLSLSLFVEDPDIRTPIGMVIDDQNQLFVIESHTHLPPSDYDGPTSDRIKVFRDVDNDGRCDEKRIFADGIQQAMNIAISPENELYVVCAREVIRLVDEDDDGVCDRKERVVFLDTLERYAHNSLLGITFDRDGWMYVSRGNTGSHAYRIEGPDGSFVEGYGDGGSIIRCRPDGSQVSEFATGFWNAFDLKFDQNGRLLAVDNDPDARGPNRLVHAVEGGDYGYRSLYGGGGNHPFQGWNGDLPGTLPYISGTGEAPSGLIDCSRTSLPASYRNGFLVTIWNENSIEYFDLEPTGGSLAATSREIFLSGDKDFRPVAIDADSHGNLFITDWMLVDYPNHGRGRIWRVANDSPDSKTTPMEYFAEREQANDQQLIGTVAEADEAELARLASLDDPFIKHAVVKRLSDDASQEIRQAFLKHELPSVRLCALLASEKADDVNEAMLATCMADGDKTIRHAALLIAGSSACSFDLDLRLALSAGQADPTLIETYLAAEANRHPEFVESFQQRKARRASQLNPQVSEQLVLQLAKDSSLPTACRAYAIERLTDEQVTENHEWIVDFLDVRNSNLESATIRRIALLSSDKLDVFRELLIDLALNQAKDSNLRSDALFALASAEVTDPEPFLSLLTDSNLEIAIEAARTWRGWLDQGEFDSLRKRIAEMKLNVQVKDRLAPALPSLQTEATNASNSIETWGELAKLYGERERGRRVFYSERVGCAKCHTVGGRGGTLGPDLGQVANSKSQSQIIDSILHPSAEYSPQYQAWFVITVDGVVHRGLQLDHKSGGKIELILEDGSQRTFAADEIEDYAVSQNSLMPDGLIESMTPGEFQDLIMFLSTNSTMKE